MTWGVHTLGFLDLQDEVEATKYFERSYNVYTHQPFFTWSENQPNTPGAGNFITGAGGFLQSVINGYGGIRLHFDYLSITNFFMPKNSNSLEFNGITYLNSRFSMKIVNQTATIKFISVDSEHPMRVTVKPSNAEYFVSVNMTISFNRDEELIMEGMTNLFGTCEMKKTELGVEAGAGSFKTNVILSTMVAILGLLKLN